MEMTKLDQMIKFFTPLCSNFWVNERDNRLIRNGVLNRKHNNIFIGLKNYDVLMMQQQNPEFPTKKFRFEPHLKHNPYKTFILGDKFLSTGIYECAFAHLLVEECISDVLFV